MRKEITGKIRSGIWIEPEAHVYCNSKPRGTYIKKMTPCNCYKSQLPIWESGCSGVRFYCPVCGIKTNWYKYNHFAMEEWESILNDGDRKKKYYRSSYTKGNFGYIKLSDCSIMKLDISQWEKIKFYTWAIQASGIIFSKISGYTISLKQLLFGGPVMFINGDCKDYREENTRKISTVEVNLLRPPRNGKYKNVSRHNGKIYARIYYRGKYNMLGFYDTDKEAALVIDAANRYLYNGYFGWINEKKQKIELTENLIKLLSGIKQKGVGYESV